MFDGFDFSRIRIEICWLIITYSAVVVAMAVDLFTGIRKAKRDNIARTSTGYKMTCTKASKYFTPMLCLTCIDLLASVLLPAPFLTMIFAAWNIFCEWKSVTEKTHEKAEIREAAKTMNVVIKNKDDIAKIVAEILTKVGEQDILNTK